MPTTRSRYIFLLIYSLFIIYGSLFPLADWRVPQLGLFSAWQQEIGRHVSRSDLLTNILAYIPIGFLVSSAFSQRLRNSAVILLATATGFLLSFSMEYLQLYLPARTSSPVDLILNVLSTLIGAQLWFWLGRESCLGEKLRTWRHTWIQDGRAADIGLAVLIVWSASQLAPFVPSLDLGDLKNGLKPLWLTLHDLSRFNGYRAVTYALNICSLGAVMVLILKHRVRVPLWLGFSCGVVFLMKIAIAGRQLSLEAVIGLLTAVVLTTGLQKLPRGGLVVASIISVAIAFVVDELRPDFSQFVAFNDFNWIPFGSQMNENVSGIGSIIEGLWPFLVLGFFAVSSSFSGRKIHAVSTGVVLAIGVFVLEYAQTDIVGRYPDITTVILAVVGWSIPVLVSRESRSCSD